MTSPLMDRIAEWIDRNDPGAGVVPTDAPGLHRLAPVPRTPSPTASRTGSSPAPHGLLETLAAAARRRRAHRRARPRVRHRVLRRRRAGDARWLSPSACGWAAWPCATGCSSTGRRTGPPPCAATTAACVWPRAPSRACRPSTPCPARAGCAPVRGHGGAAAGQAGAAGGAPALPGQARGRGALAAGLAGGPGAARGGPGARRWARPPRPALAGAGAGRAPRRRARRLPRRRAQGDRAPTSTDARRGRRHQGARALRLASRGAHARRQPRRARRCCGALVERPGPVAAGARVASRRSRPRSRSSPGPSATRARARRAPSGAPASSCSGRSAPASPTSASSTSAAPRWPRSCGRRASPRTTGPAPDSRSRAETAPPG